MDVCVYIYTLRDGEVVSSAGLMANTPTREFFIG